MIKLLLSSLWLSSVIALSLIGCPGDKPLLKVSGGNSVLDGKPETLFSHHRASIKGAAPTNCVFYGSHQDIKGCYLILESGKVVNIMLRPEFPISELNNPGTLETSIDERGLNYFETFEPKPQILVLGPCPNPQQPRTQLFAGPVNVTVPWNSKYDGLFQLPAGHTYRIDCDPQTHIWHQITLPW